MFSMAKVKQQSVIADLIAAAVAPGLVMGMIFCLISFLILVFYRDGYQIRVNYLFALYIFASVLIARIAIESGRAYAMTYTVILGLAMMLVINRFAVFQGPLAIFSPLINLGLLGLVGYLADRIVFDCTLVEADRDTSGEGLLQSLGLVKSDLTKESTAPRKRKRKHNPGVTILYFALLAIPLYGIGQLFLPAGNDAIRRSALYLLFGYFFCSFALLVTTSFLGLRRYLNDRGVEVPTQFSATWLSLGLIGTLVFLGLCLFLPLPGRQFGLFELPFDVKAMDGLTASRWGWGNEGAENSNPGDPQTTQTSPQSNSSTSQDGSGGQSSSGQSSSGQGSSGQGSSGQGSSGQGSSGQGSSGQGSSGQGSSGQSSSGQSSSGQSSSGQSSSGQSGSGQGSSGQSSSGQGSSGQSSSGQSNSGQSGSGQSSSGQSSSGQSSSGQSSSGQSSSGQSSSGQSSSGQSSSGQSSSGQSSSGQSSSGQSSSGQGSSGQSSSGQGSSGQSNSGQSSSSQDSTNNNSASSSQSQQSGSSVSSPSKASEGQKNDSSSSESNSKSGSDSSSMETKAEQPPESEQPSQPQSTPPSSSSWFNFDLGSWLGVLFKWITIAILIGVVAYYAMNHRDELVKLWREFLKWWNGLWGIRDDDTLPDVEQSQANRPTRRAFASFANPFRRGGKLELAEIIRYTFDAMEAWGAERGLERKGETTAEEYVRALGALLPKNKEDLAGFSNAYTRLAYAGNRPVSLDPAVIQRIWQSMEQQVSAPSTIQTA
jgi:hypothetical protein